MYAGKKTKSLLNKTLSLIMVGMLILTILPVHAYAGDKGTGLGIQGEEDPNQTAVNEYAALLGPSPKVTYYAAGEPKGLPLAPPEGIACEWTNPQGDILDFLANGTHPAWDEDPVEGTRDLVITKGEASLTVTYQIIVMPELNTLQLLVIEAMALQESERESFVTNVLEPMREKTTLTSQEADALVLEVLKYTTTLSPNKVKAAVLNYVKRAQNLKGLVETEVLLGLPEFKAEPRGFSNIAAKINLDVTGHPDDMRGLQFIVKFLTRLVELDLPPQDGKEAKVGPVAYDHPDDNTKIQFKLREDLDPIIIDKIEQNLAGLLKYAESVMLLVNKKPGVVGDTDFQRMLSYAQILVNEEAYFEVNTFKGFLNENSSQGNPVYQGGPLLPSVEIIETSIEKDYGIRATAKIRPIIPGDAVVIFKLVENGNIPVALMSVHEEFVDEEVELKAHFPGFMGDEYTVRLLVWDRLDNSVEYMGIDLTEPVDIK